MAARMRLLPLFVVVALAAGCAAGSSPSTEVSLEPSPSEDAVESEPAASEPGGSDAALCPPAVCDGPAAPGDYSSTSAGATISFTLAGQGWSGLADFPGEGFALFHDSAGNGQYGIWVAPVQGTVWSDVCGPPDTRTIGTSAAEFLAYLSAVEGITAGDPVNLSVGGKPAMQMDLTAASPCDGPRMWLFVLPVHVAFYFDDGDVVRVWAVETGSGLVAIMVDAPADAYDALLAKAGELLATMTITSLP